MRRFLTQSLLGTVLAILFSGLMPCTAAASAPAAFGNVESQILDQQKKIHRLKKGIQGQRTRVKATRQKEISLLAELESIDTRLKQEREKMAELKGELTRHEALIRKKLEELGKARADKEAAKTHIQNRLNAYYRMGPEGVLNVIFASETLPELLSFQEYFHHLVQYDKEAIALYRTKITALSEARLDLEKGKKALLAVITEAKSQEQRLAATREERLTLLKRVKTEKKLYQRALEEIEEAAEQLTATLEKLKKEADQEAPSPSPRPGSSKKRRPGGWRDFAAQKGRLNPPVTGSVTTRFGKNTKGRFGLTTYANGIDIKTKPGAEIRAIYGGKVVYAGVLRGYGNLIIIDHGQHYYSLISRAAKLSKKEGETVKRGEVIGVMADQEGLLGEGLHFEIRHGTEPENPLHWVNNAKLKIRAVRKAKKE